MRLNDLRLSDLRFVDLYLGEDFAEIKGLQGSEHLTDPAPKELDAELQTIRRLCRSKHVEEKDREFSISVDGHRYRVTMLKEFDGTNIFVLRRFSLQVRALSELAFFSKIKTLFTRPDLKGLILIAGETGAGKTTTASAIVKARLENIGGVGLAIEDPPEVNLSGTIGRGRCIQVRASRQTGGYKEPLVLALRSNPDLIFLGEIREESAAAEVVHASINGHLIISTIHAASVSTAIERLAALASGDRDPQVAYKMIAMGLKAVIWQQLTVSELGHEPALSYTALVLDGEQDSGPRGKIREGKCGQVEQDVDQQMRRSALNPHSSTF